MKLSILMVDCGQNVMFDTDPVYIYSVMEKLEDKSGMFALSERSGVRFTVNLHNPGPGFFFSFADFADSNKEGVIVFNDKLNLVGGYFKRPDESVEILEHKKCEEGEFFKIKKGTEK